MHFFAYVSAFFLKCFRGGMTADVFEDILEQVMVPFLRDKPNMVIYMDNHPAHNAATTRAYMNRRGMYRMQTPAYSPDMNPIEKAWYALKYAVYQKQVPTTQGELMHLINEFWHRRVDQAFCQSFIKNLLTEVYKGIIDKDGGYGGG